MQTSPTSHSPPLAERPRPHVARRARAALAALTLAVPLVVAGCYPDQISDVEDLDTVTTLYDTATTFTTLRTYALVDSVVSIPRDSGEAVPATLNTAVLAEIRADMAALGWTEVQNPATTRADVYVAAGVTLSQYIYADWYSYWGYWPYWPPGWAGGGWYYPVPIVYSYEVGTLVVTMVDGVHVDPQRGVPIRWLAAVRGVGNGAASNQSRAVSGLRQAFEQSPYLDVGAPTVTPSAR